MADETVIIASFPQTTIPATGGVVSGQIVHQGAPIEATSSEDYATVIKNNDQYITVEVPANFGAQRTFTVTLEQFGVEQTVTFTQLTAASTPGFAVMYGAVELNATEASGSITVVAMPTHHYEVVKSVSWLKIETAAGYIWDEDHGDVTAEQGTVTIGSGIVPASGTVALTITAEDNETPATAEDPAPARQTTVLVRNITTGEVVSVLISQKGGQAEE